MDSTDDDHLHGRRGLVRLGNGSCSRGPNARRAHGRERQSEGRCSFSHGQRRGTERRGQGGHPGHPRRDRQELAADGQHRVSLRHDRPPPDRLGRTDQGQPLDARQVHASTGWRTRTSSPGRSTGPGPGARPRAAWWRPSSSGCSWSRPAGAPRPRGRCAGRSSTSRPSRPRSSRLTRGSSRGPGSCSSEVSVQPSPKQPSPASPRCRHDAADARLREDDASSTRSSRNSWSPRGPRGSSATRTRSTAWST